VCLIVVVTTVVEVPVPKVYVRTVSDDAPSTDEVTAGPRPVPRGTDGLDVTPEIIAELMDEASDTGQTV
jgi:hypothetical protein